MEFHGRPLLTKFEEARRNKICETTIIYDYSRPEPIRTDSEEGNRHLKQQLREVLESHPEWVN